MLSFEHWIDKKFEFVEMDDIMWKEKEQIIAKPWRSPFCELEFRSLLRLLMYINGRSCMMSELLDCKKCLVCNFSTHSELALKRHMTTSHGPKDNKCSTCNYSSASEYNLRKHVRSVHEKKERSNKCSMCDFTSVQKGALTLHVKHVH